MNKQNRFDLNLSSHPTSNRRLFFLLSASLVLIFLILAVAGGRIFIVYSTKSNDVEASLTKLEREEKSIQTEENQLLSQIDSLEKSNNKKVNLINNLIYRKSFSWVDFLSTLESTLPNECYIVSLSPNFRGKDQVDFKLLLASPNLDSLLKFIQNLDKQGFQQIRISSESRAATGFFLYEMSLSYERNI
jgi:Tfp pilus assembly protein PilN